jgi:hypothetical protein
MRPVERIHRLHDILKPENLTSVVDIGANLFAGSPPYGTLRRSDRCEVIGFEPLPEAFDALTKLARHNDRFLPLRSWSRWPPKAVRDQEQRPRVDAATAAQHWQALGPLVGACG